MNLYEHCAKWKDLRTYIHMNLTRGFQRRSSDDFFIWCKTVPEWGNKRYQIAKAIMYTKEDDCTCHFKMLNFHDIRKKSILIVYKNNRLLGEFH